MRLLRCSDTGEFSLTQFLDEAIPPYAILSHMWGADTEEVTFEDLTNGTGKDKPGYKKIQFCGEQAALDDLEYFWIDTCCINKSNYAELSQAINSMFRWYRNATRCYVYLSDVTGRCIDDDLHSQWESDLGRSRWFTRGWTLQELLAPRSIEFFSCERVRIGDRSSLTQHIQRITGVPTSALQGARLSQFGVDERFLWMERRQTKLAEDKVYAMLGILDVEIPLYYGEGAGNSYKRVREVIDKRERCIQDLRLTDPRDDKKRIEKTKGGLLEDSYRWILENSDFQRWRDDEQSRLLWIKGDPGKGKTMLLCGIINELNKSMAKTHQLSYFFCQEMDPRINNATAVLRGLLYLFVNQQPSLVSHIRKKYDHSGKALFEDANAWVALSEIFVNTLQDSSMNTTYLVIDALDECVKDLEKLIDFVVQTSSTLSRVKWIVSSRNWPNIKGPLERAENKVILSLELNVESVSTAVSYFVRDKVAQLAQEKRYNGQTRSAVLDYLTSNADSTFLWVALVCQNLKEIPQWKVLTKLKTFPPGLDALYKRMMQDISDSDDADLCIHILALIAIVYRPITLEELTTLAEGLEDIVDDLESLLEIVSLCGSFLTIRDGIIYFIHQSAKEFLLSEVYDTIFPSGSGVVHYALFSKSLVAMSTTLRRDIYSLKASGYPIEQVKQPDPDPLAGSRYSCIYWIDHLCDLDPGYSADHKVNLQDGGAVDNFLRQKYLYWLEALSLCKSMSKGVVTMAKLEALIQERADAPKLMELIRDARRFIAYHKLAIENSPLQTYGSALMFSPTRSLIKALFKEEGPKWITIKPAMRDRWGACLQTLEGHGSWVLSVAFSYDSARVASASIDKTVKVWDASSGECLQTLKGHSDAVWSVAFSHDSARVASASDDNTVKVWDASSGECLQTLKGHSRFVNSVAFSHDSIRLASASGDKTVKVWKASSNMCVQTLKGHTSSVKSVAFSHNSTRLASGSEDKTVKIWDASSGECLSTLEGHSDAVCSVAFSHDSARLASSSCDKTVKIWDANSGECIQMLEGHSDSVRSIIFSYNSTKLASGSDDTTVKVWDTNSGDCLQTLESHSGSVRSVAFSHNSAWLASASDDHTAKIWEASDVDATSRTLEGHSSSIKLVTFSYDSTRLVSVSCDDSVKIWDASSGKCLQTLEGRSSTFGSVTFSHDSERLASVSSDKAVKIWDASSGECLRTFKGHSNWVTQVVFSHNSKWLASVSWDKTVKIWDTSSGECLQTLKGHSRGIASIAFANDSSQIASASGDRTVKVWCTSSGECLRTFKGHSDVVDSVTFSHDSKWLASGSWDETVKIWSASSGKCLRTLKGHSNWVTQVVFSYNSTRLASASLDETVKIWNAGNGECLQTLSIGMVLSNISFDATGSYLHTKIGNIRIGTSSVSNIPSLVTEAQSPRYQGAALLSDGAWVTYSSQNLVWVPSEYRPYHMFQPSCSAVSGERIAIGTGSGKVLICEFELDKCKHFSAVLDMEAAISLRAHSTSPWIFVRSFQGFLVLVLLLCFMSHYVL